MLAHTYNPVLTQTFLNRVNVGVNVARVIKVTAPFPDMKISGATHLVAGSLELHLKEQDKSGISMSANIANIANEVNLVDRGRLTNWRTRVNIYININANRTKVTGISMLMLYAVACFRTTTDDCTLDL